MPVRDPNGGHDFLSGARNDNSAGHRLIYRAVVFVDQQVFRPPNHILRADGVLEIAYERRFGFVLVSHAAILTAPARFGELASVTGNSDEIPQAGASSWVFLIGLEGVRAPLRRSGVILSEVEESNFCQAARFAPLTPDPSA